MKMVKSLLLGSAAGLVAVTAGQAADLPVKAKPVEYVKICSLYGAGFYYMPGTDLCIKIGGWVRAEAAWGVNGNMTWGPFNGNANNRTTSNEALRARGYITADVRNQTEYGTVRGYIAVGLSTNDVGLQVANLVDSANRAFVQWAGMTAGLAQSFYDFYSVPKYQYRGGYLPASDTGDGGWWVWAYTAQFGGGFSGTISSEARRMTQICNTNVPAPSTSCTYGPGGYTSSTAGGAAAVAPVPGSYGGMQSTDFVANLRVDQAWGGAQVMGAAHMVNANYYSPTVGVASNILSHPSDKWGFAVGGGLLLNLPFITQGDSFMAQVNYTQGALRYLFNTPNTNWGKVDGASEGYTILSDCVYGVGPAGAGQFQSGCNLTTAWGFNAAFEHYWTPAWHTSLYGAWYAVSYNSSANGMLCANQGQAFTFSNASGWTATGGCNNNWSTWGVGSRTQWDVTKTFYLGVEVLYQGFHSAQSDNGRVPGGAFGAQIAGPICPAGGCFIENPTNWMVSVRAHRDFLP